MRTKFRVYARKMATFIMFLIMIFFVSSQAAFAEDLAPNVTSNKPDYIPGEIVTLSGSGWEGDASVKLSVDDASDAAGSWKLVEDITTASDGTFSYQFNLPSVPISLYEVTVFGNTTSRIAAATFTDSEIAAENPSIIITKSAEELNFDAVGNVIHYTLQATNNGNVTLHNVMIIDPLIGVLKFSCPCPSI